MIEMDDGTQLTVRRLKCGAKGASAKKRGMPRAVVHIVHGMAEHSGRYTRFAQALARRGFEVWAADQRGFGLTATIGGNDPSKGGLLGHNADHDGFFRVVADLGIINAKIAEVCRKDYGKVPPIFLFGHSWGSFLSQAYIEKYACGDDKRGIPPLAGCLLSGTRGPGGAEIALGAPFLSCLAALTGKRRFSEFVYKLGGGNYEKFFDHIRTDHDWLSRDEREVDMFIADPLCGKACTIGFYRDMIGGLKAIHKSEAMKAIPADLSVYVFCGNADPVGNNGEGPAKLVDIYRSNGIKDLEFVVYEGARHETLNETNRDEVTKGVITWLEKHCTRGA